MFYDTTVRIWQNIILTAVRRRINLRWKGKKTKRFWLTANELWYVIGAVSSICSEEKERKNQKAAVMVVYMSLAHPSSQAFWCMCSAASLNKRWPAHQVYHGWIKVNTFSCLASCYTSLYSTNIRHWGSAGLLYFYVLFSGPILLKELWFIRTHVLFLFLWLSFVLAMITVYSPK